MSEIQTFKFDRTEFEKIRKYKYGKNWPAVYILESKKEIYIGETTSVFTRSRQHYENPERAKLDSIHVISDDEFNKSATLDTESWLIQYFSAEGTYKLQNGNSGLKNHEYFDREKYKAKFEVTWEKLKEMGLVKQDLVQLRNSDLFKYSPYKALTEDQLLVVKDLSEKIERGTRQSYLVSGKPGTGKTVLATYLIKYLKERKEIKDLEIGLVVPMTALRNTLKKVFSKISGLSPNMVIGPADVVKKKYDLLIVDEAHRLKRRVNIPNYGSFDATNKGLNFGNEGTELDWILASSDQHIFFYDKNQSVRPSDIGHARFAGLNAIPYDLVSQLRVEGGEEYIKFIEDLFELKKVPYKASNYDFKMYDDIHKMVADIKQKDSEVQLARVVAGYAWSWSTKNGGGGHDIEIDGLRLVWNSTNTDWVNSPNAVNEVGCIHTVQGYDLNYTGVIVGPELSYDETTRQLVVDAEKYKDINGKRSITGPEELERYVINIYKTLLTRGIKGTYIYVVDEKLRNHFKQLMSATPEEDVTVYSEPVLSPLTLEMARVPLVGSAPCGNPLLGEENIEEYIEVEKSKIKPGYEYFILLAEGDSMNLAGINNGDLVLCRQQQKAETGDRVVALLGGENVTIKMYDKKDGRRILLPRSSNKSHTPIIPEEGDNVQGVVQEILATEPTSE